MIEDLHDYVQKRIKNNSCSVPKLNPQSDIEIFIYNSARRLLNSFDLMKKRCASQFDFECCLKNYLSVVKKELYCDIELSEDAYRLGLIQNKDGVIRLELKYPQFASRDLIRQAQLVNYESQKDIINTDGRLLTNHYIKELTGYSYFKSSEQKLCVDGALRTPDGFSTLVSMSTGGGKSLITQTVAYQSIGLTIVVVPTISLMLNQYDSAKKTIKHNTDNEIFYYHSGKDLSDFINATNQKKARLLFISPESIIKNKLLKKYLFEKNIEGYLKNIIIDEAHIILEWGSSFRVDFQCLDAWRRELIKSNSILRTFLLSATFDRNAVRQLKRYYSEGENWIEIRCDKLRKEIRYNVVKARNIEDKSEKLIELVDILPHPMIIYVKSPDDAINTCNLLKKKGYSNIRSFTGNTGNDARERIIEDWLADKFEIMVATCAFGVGVDKKDIRTVLHTYIPENPGKYYQEAGRGGRDGMPSLSAVLYTLEDIDAAFGMASKVLTPEKISGRWFSMLNSVNTKALGQAKYSIDTYIKPDYNESDEYIDFANDRDIAWNVYVILLLRRNSLIEIEAVDYIDGKYIFFIMINDKTILSKTNLSDELFLKIRDYEWENTEKEFLKMKSNLKKVGKKCWSEVFNDTYTLTDERCSGCDYPHEIIDGESKVLKKHISYPNMRKSKALSEYFRFSQTSLVICHKEKKEVIKDLLLMGGSLIVSDCTKLNEYSDINSDNPLFMYMDYEEFFDYVGSDDFFVSGSIVIDVPNDVAVRNRLINIVDNIINNETDFILVTDEDYYIDSRKKNMSEIINGTCKQI